MTQSTPPPSSQSPVDYGSAAGRPRTSGAAIASLILGILGCIPFITGLLAIVLGIVGIKKTASPAVGGRGLAIAGLVLGIVSVIGWTGWGGLLGYGFLASRPGAGVGRQFLQDVSAGNINAAMGESTGFTAEDLKAETEKMNSFGGLQSVSLTSFNMSTVNGNSTVTVGGMANFANGPRACTIDLVKTGGVYKVTAYSIP